MPPQEDQLSPSKGAPEVSARLHYKPGAYIKSYFPWKPDNQAHAVSGKRFAMRNTLGRIVMNY